MPDSSLPPSSPSPPLIHRCSPPSRRRIPPLHRRRIPYFAAPRFAVSVDSSKSGTESEGIVATRRRPPQIAVAAHRSSPCPCQKPRLILAARRPHSVSASPSDSPPPPSWSASLCLPVGSPPPVICRSPIWTSGAQRR